MERRTFIKAIGLGAAGLLTSQNLTSAATTTKSYSELTVSCFGDSTTWGANGLPDGGGNAIAWPGKVQKLLGFKTVNNFGKKGSRLTLASDRQDSFIERLDSVIAKPADVFIVMGGVNDFQHDVPLGSLNDGDMHTIYGAVQVIIETILTKYPQSKLIFMTPLKCKFQHPTKNYPAANEPNGQGLVLAQYAAAIREACDFFSVPVIDMFANSGISPLVPSQQQAYMPDGLHYNEAGYERLAKRIAGSLEQYL